MGIKDSPAASELLAMVQSARVRAALMGKLSVFELDEGERNLYFDLAPLMPPTAKAEAYFRRMRARGGCVGIDDAGNLVRENADGTVEVIAPDDP